jgi:putative Ca2+/H+ antiporter (TMEM165/GDT1 family)
LEETILDIVAEAFAASLFSVAVAEFGDKTQLGVITLAASLKKPRAIFLGIIAGYLVVAGSAVLVGQALLAIAPLSILTAISGLVFIVVGLLMLKVDVENSVAGPRGRSPFLAASLIIILTELGDKTQIVTIALAARFAQPAAVFAGALTAFIIIDGLSIALADRFSKRVPTGKVRKASAIIFIILGILTILGIF